MLAVILPKERDRRFITIRRGGSLTDADHHLLALWAAACAEHVLHHFEAGQPQTTAPAMPSKRSERGPAARSRCLHPDGRRSRHGRRPAPDRAPRHAAFAAGQAAVVAHVAAHELGAAAYAIKASRAAVASAEASRRGRGRVPLAASAAPAAIRELVLDDQRLRNEICWSSSRTRPTSDGAANAGFFLGESGAPLPSSHALVRRVDQ